MKKLVSLSLFLFFINLFLFAQKDVIVSIGDHNYTKDEYQKIYTKNNTQLNDESDAKTPEEYLDLFINYKLKVIEAEKQSLDTVQEFIDELAGYREELAKPYLTDIKITDSTIQQTYFRNNNMLKASHVLVKLQANASPEDTLTAYNKLLEIRQKFINKEKTFEELALEYSDDPSASYNKGYLGYFKAFSMVTEFENAAYSTPVGEVSMPFRSSYGYHIVYVQDILNVQGEVKVSHIMKMYRNRNDVSAEEEAKLKHDIDSIYKLVQNGGDFAKLAEELSDDKTSARKAGDMGYISRAFNVPEFAENVYALENNGDYSAPFKSVYGWHIVKRTDYRPVATFEEIKDELISKIKKDPLRSEHSKELYYLKKKKELNLISYPENIERFKKLIDDSGTSDTIESQNFAEELKDLPLYKIANTVYDVDNFYQIQKNQKNNDKRKFLKHIVLSELNKYDETVINDYMDKNLEKLYPEFAEIMQEYHDGMLLFSVMEKEVWNKAVEDSIGLADFYERNKGKYIWDDYFEGTLFKFNNEEIRDSCMKLMANGITDTDSLLSIINAKHSNSIRINNGRWEKGTNKRVDFLKFDGPQPDGFKTELEYAQGEVVKGGAAKTLDEARGLYISDYQDELEVKWIEEMRNNTKIKVNKKLLKQIKSVK